MKNCCSLAWASIVLLCPSVMQLSNLQELQKKKSWVCFYVFAFALFVLLRNDVDEVRKNLF